MQKKKIRVIVRHRSPCNLTRKDNLSHGRVLAWIKEVNQKKADILSFGDFLRLSKVTGEIYRELVFIIVITIVVIIIIIIFITIIIFIVIILMMINIIIIWLFTFYYVTVNEH